MLRDVGTSGKQLLIVDDDKHSREGYQMYLSGAGFNVEALGGGIDASNLRAPRAPISSCSISGCRTSTDGKWPGA